MCRSRGLLRSVCVCDDFPLYAVNVRQGYLTYLGGAYYSKL